MPGTGELLPSLKMSVGKMWAKKKQASPHSSRKCRSDLFLVVRPEGFEPPAY
jgi:hypothetical protein